MNDISKSRKIMIVESLIAISFFSVWFVMGLIAYLKFEAKDEMRIFMKLGLISLIGVIVVLILELYSLRHMSIKKQRLVLIVAAIMYLIFFSVMEYDFIDVVIHDDRKKLAYSVGFIIVIIMNTILMTLKSVSLYSLYYNDNLKIDQSDL
ncbi:hypothetical protein [Haploplasma axanthum]|uniref:Uncharacterized protein n=1 Tax=Haploplasma axanthum TaxID=29552 RepID=A0A449BDF6_HAPAX|nr:hypothetical protein [Haploplasma axanthum]VEU80493.1 Uncharacterised protein [Haploplasma axanthum]